MTPSNNSAIVIAYDDQDNLTLDISQNILNNVPEIYITDKQISTVSRKNTVEIYSNSPSRDNSNTLVLLNNNDDEQWGEGLVSHRNDNLLFTVHNETVNSPLANTPMSAPPANNAPVNTVPGGQTIAEDTAIHITGVSVNDVDGNLSTVKLFVSQGGMSVFLSGSTSIIAGANGSNSMTLSGTQAGINASLAWLYYQGAYNYVGADILTITSTDSNAVTDIDTVAITVTAVNDAPLNTVPGGQTIAEDTAIHITGVSVNDVDGNLSTVKLFVSQGGMSVFLSGSTSIIAGANGSNSMTLSGTQAGINASLAWLYYQGAYNYVGADILTITSTDSNAATDIDTVAITVTTVNDSPVITSSGNSSIPENTTTVMTVTVTDIDLPSDIITFSITGGADQTKFSINSSSGALTFNTSRDFEIPTDFDVNNVYEVQVTADDGNGGSDVQLILVTLNDVNENPSTSNDLASFNENDPARLINLTANDTDVDLGNVIEITGIDITGTLGTVTIDPDKNNVTYDPNRQFVLLAHGETVTDTFTYTVSDGNGGVDTGIVTITITGENTAPVITTSNLDIIENQTVTGLVLANDSDVPIDTLTWSITGNGADDDQFVIDLSSGVLTFINPPNFENPGDADQNNVWEIEVCVNDGIDDTTKVITVTVEDIFDDFALPSQTLNSSIFSNTLIFLIPSDLEYTDKNTLDEETNDNTQDVPEGYSGDLARYSNSPPKNEAIIQDGEASPDHLPNSAEQILKVQDALISQKQKDKDTNQDIVSSKEGANTNSTKILKSPIMSGSKANPKVNIPQSNIQDLTSCVIETIYSLNMM